MAKDVQRNSKISTATTLAQLKKHDNEKTAPERVGKRLSNEETIKKTSEDLQKLINKKPSKVIEFKEMGRKKLAYPIKKEVSGYYYVMTVEVTNETLQEFDRKVSINENVLRHLIIKVEGE